MAATMTSPRERALRRIVGIWRRGHHKGPVSYNSRPSWLPSPHSSRSLELDVYLPRLNIAFEVNGKAYHGDPRTCARDAAKLVGCRAKGVRLIVIPAWRFGRFKELAGWVFKQLDHAPAHLKRPKKRRAKRNGQLKARAALQHNARLLGVEY